jgi:hypothetical protein
MLLLVISIPSISSLSGSLVDPEDDGGVGDVSVIIMSGTRDC